MSKELSQGELYEQYSDMVFKIANSLGQRFLRSDADDLAQTAWRKIFTSLHKYDPEKAKMITFLHTVAYYSMLKQCNYERSTVTIAVNDAEATQVERKLHAQEVLEGQLGPSDALAVYSVIVNDHEALGITTRSRGRAEGILAKHFAKIGWSTERFFNAFVHLESAIA